MDTIKEKKKKNQKYILGKTHCYPYPIFAVIGVQAGQIIRSSAAGTGLPLVIIILIYVKPTEIEFPLKSS